VISKGVIIAWIKKQELGKHLVKLVNMDLTIIRMKIIIDIIQKIEGCEKMQVGELIEILKKVDYTKPVIIEMDDEKSEIETYYDLPNEFVLSSLELQ